MELSQFISYQLTTLIAVLMIILMVCFKRPLLLLVVVSTTILVAYDYLKLPNPSDEELKGFIKITLLLPCGLGAICLVSMIPESLQKPIMPFFEKYVIFAVLANILVMIFAEKSGSLRGYLTVPLCALLSVWLLFEIRKIEDQTIAIHQQIFLFKASPLPWVFSHALYRLSLMSLPAFDGSNYLFLELFSLATMWILYRFQKKQKPIYYYFGYADTIAVSVLVFCSQQLPSASSKPLSEVFSALNSSVLDLFFIPLQFGVMIFASRAIYTNIKRSHRNR